MDCRNNGEFASVALERYKGLYKLKCISNYFVNLGLVYHNPNITIMSNAMNLGLNTSLKGIGELIQTKHKVPKNQREYAWEDKHIYDFIRDITEAKGESKAQYFMGTIVVTGTSDLREVVDGQQRMATTCIVIAAARDYLINTKQTDNIESANLLSQRYLLEKDPSDLETYPYLILNDIDNQFFRDFIIELPAAKNLTSFKKVIPSHVRLKRAYDIAYEEITKIAEAPPGKARQQLTDLIKYLQEKIQVIILKAPDEASAFILFETLNDRGIDLAISDLLKNFLLGKGQARIEEIKTKWHEMKTSLEASDAGDDIVMYIRHLWCSKNGLVREKDLYKEIKNLVINNNKAVAFAEDLSKNAKIYAQLVSPDEQFWRAYGDETYKSVKALNIINHTQSRPLILAVLNKFELKEIRKAIRLIEAWSFRFSVTKRLGGEGIEREYSNLAKEVSLGTIKTTAELQANIKGVPSDDDFKEGLASYPIKKAALARYMLVELEKTKVGNGSLEYIPNENPEMVNLEHILPKTFPTSNWPDFDQETHFKYALLLGNLAIMNSGENKLAGQDAFVTKKQIYGNSQIKLTSELATYVSWKPADIMKRQDILGALAVKRWAV